jgi:glycosyltransferase involved in cell wall biosynthesis
MRIMMLAQWYPPIVGGEELHVQRLSRELVGRGHQVTVATLAHPGSPARADDDGVEVFRLRSSAQRIQPLFADLKRQSAAPFPDPELSRAVDRLARRRRVDVMHAHNWMVHAALPTALMRSTPLLLTLHDFSLVCATKVLLNRGVDCSGPAPLKCLRCASHHYGAAKGTATLAMATASSMLERRAVAGFLAVSRAVARGNGIERHPHAIVPNFIGDRPPAPTTEAEAFIGRLPSEPFLLFVGALGRLKGLPVLLDAYRRLREAPPLVIIGYPMPETPELLHDLPPNASVLGQWPPDAVRLAWGRALAAIAPSICQEACPTVVIEAMQAGIPVVASRIGGIPDLVADGETGVLVEPGDPRALATAIASLLADRAHASALGVAAAMRARRFTASAVVPRIEEIYRQVVETGTLRDAG